MGSSGSTTKRAHYAHDLAHLTGQDVALPYPPAITQAGQGGKFLPNGQAMPFPGNTFICHIDPQTEEHGALVWLQNQMVHGPFGEYFAYLPPSSFHMTVFSSICGVPLGGDCWPIGIPKGTGLPEITRIFSNKIEDGSCFQQCQIEPIGMYAGYSLTVAGASPPDKNALQKARYLLQELTEIRRTDFETYRFHITLCYQKRWMPIDVAKAHLEFMERLFLKFRSKARKFELGPVEYCTFDDMEHFELVKFI